MTASTTPSDRPNNGIVSRDKSSHGPVWLAGALIALAGLAAYANSFSGAFLLDDGPAIMENATIRRLWPLGRVLFAPPANTTAGGRPVVNLSLALNYAAGGLRPWGYHALNLAIHLAAGLALFGLVRRTLLLPRWRERWGASALTVAGAAGAWWTVHPLQTEAVTYVVQRTEALMGLFYLLTLYAFVRAVGSERAGRWQLACAGCCLLGMASKEVMASAPVMVFFFDRTFAAGSFKAAWRQRWKLYLGLAATWVALGWLILSTGGNRSGTVGFNVGVGWWAYALTQFEAVVRYWWLAVWPHPLVFEYGTFWVEKAWTVLPYAVPVLAVGLGSVWALWRRPVWGFFGLVFFSILAPTSLVPGTTQMIVEHRMYLALAAVLVGLVIGLERLLGRRSRWIFAAVVTALAALTARRNQDYASDLALWRDTVAKRPDNALAHNTLGLALSKAGETEEAIACFQKALSLRPDYVEARVNYGAILANTGHPAEAIAQYERVLQLIAGSPYAYSVNVIQYNLGLTLLYAGNTAEAIAHLQESLRLQPDYADAHFGLGLALAASGRLPEAIAHYAEAVRLAPDSFAMHLKLADALADAGRLPESITQYEEAIRLNPDSGEARYSLGNILCDTGQTSAGIVQYEEVLRITPDSLATRLNLGRALAQTGRLPEAIDQFEQVIKRQPDSAEGYAGLGMVLGQAGRLDEGIAACQKALELDPQLDLARAVLARLQAEQATSKN